MVEVQDILIAALDDTPATRVRAVRDEGTITEYAAALKANKEAGRIDFPALGVCQDEATGKLWVWDGGHRLAAARQLGWETFHCQVTPGDFGEALRRARLANVEHGRRRTNEDKLKIALEVAGEELDRRAAGLPKRSGQEIGATVGLSHTYINQAIKEVTKKREAEARERSEAAEALATVTTHLQALWDDGWRALPHTYGTIPIGAAELADPSSITPHLANRLAIGIRLIVARSAATTPRPHDVLRRADGSILIVKGGGYSVSYIELKPGGGRQESWTYEQDVQNHEDRHHWSPTLGEGFTIIQQAEVRPSDAAVWLPPAGGHDWIAGKPERGGWPPAELLPEGWLTLEPQPEPPPAAPAAPAERAEASDQAPQGAPQAALPVQPSAPPRAVRPVEAAPSEAFKRPARPLEDVLRDVRSLLPSLVANTHASTGGVGLQGVNRAFWVVVESDEGPGDADNDASQLEALIADLLVAATATEQAPAEPTEEQAEEPKAEAASEPSPMPIGPAMVKLVEDSYGEEGIRGDRFGGPPATINGRLWVKTSAVYAAAFSDRPNQATLHEVVPEAAWSADRLDYKDALKRAAGLRGVRAAWRGRGYVLTGQQLVVEWHDSPAAKRRATSHQRGARIGRCIARVRALQQEGVILWPPDGVHQQTPAVMLERLKDPELTDTVLEVYEQVLFPPPAEEQGPRQATRRDRESWPDPEGNMVVEDCDDEDSTGELVNAQEPMGALGAPPDKSQGSEAAIAGRQDLIKALDDRAWEEGSVKLEIPASVTSMGMRARTISNWLRLVRRGELTAAEQEALLRAVRNEPEPGAAPRVDRDALLDRLEGRRSGRPMSLIAGWHSDAISRAETMSEAEAEALVARLDALDAEERALRASLRARIDQLAKAGRGGTLTSDLPEIVGHRDLPDLERRVQDAEDALQESGPPARPAPRAAAEPTLPEELLAYRHLLGTMPDHEIAQLAGSTPSIVGRARRALNLPAHKPAGAPFRKRQDADLAEFTGEQDDLEAQFIAMEPEQLKALYKRAKGISPSYRSTHERTAKVLAEHVIQRREAA